MIGDSAPDGPVDGVDALEAIVVSVLRFFGVCFDAFFALALLRRAEPESEPSPVDGDATDAAADGGMEMPLDVSCASCVRRCPRVVRCRLLLVGMINNSPFQTRTWNALLQRV